MFSLQPKYVLQMTFIYDTHIKDKDTTDALFTSGCCLGKSKSCMYA